MKLDHLAAHGVGVEHMVQQHHGAAWVGNWEQHTGAAALVRKHHILAVAEHLPARRRQRVPLHLVVGGGFPRRKKRHIRLPAGGLRKQAPHLLFHGFFPQGKAQPHTGNAENRLLLLM